MGRDAGPDSGPPTTCPDQDLGSATGESVASGTLDGTWNDVRPSCAEIMNGEELIYGWTAPSAGEWVFDTIGSEVDTVMAIHTGASCPGTEVACNDDANEAIQSSVRRTLTAGQEIWIVVDEYRNLEFGTFQLNVHTGVPTLESSCDDGLDEDRDGAADCGDRDCASAAGC